MKLFGLIGYPLEHSFSKKYFIEKFSKENLSDYRYKAVFNMHVIEGYSHKEIAEILGINEGTSKSQLARAKTVLRKIVEARLNNTSSDAMNL